MKKLLTIVLMMTALSSCVESASSNSSKTSSSSNKNISSSLIVDSSSKITSNKDSSIISSSSNITLLGEVQRVSASTYVDEHQYKGYTYAAFPSYSEASWNTSLKFTLSADGTYYIVSDYLGADRLLNKNTLIIPAYYNGLPVEEIAQAAEGIGAFSELTWLENVYLPHTIKRIGYGSFSLSSIKNLYIDCAELEDFDGRNWVFYPPLDPSYEGMNVYFGPNVKRIPQRLFFPNVTEPDFACKIKNVFFTQNSKVESIGAHAFHDVVTLKSISLPSTIKEIGEFAFYKTSITELTLPSSLTSIANDAFAFSTLVNVKINDKLEYIGDRAFSYTHLEGLDLSNTKLEVIEDECFAYTSLNKGIAFPETLKDIGERAFLNSKIKDLIIPNNVEIIRDKAFSNGELERVYLGTSLKEIGNYAFYNNDKLESLEIASVSIKDFKLGNHIFTNAGKEKGMQVYFLDGVTTLPANMFFATSNIDELPVINVLSLPASLISINDKAFYALDIERVNYRGTLEQYELLDCEFTNLDIGGRVYA